MQAHDIVEERWNVKLAPYLTGKAQQAYTALNTDETKDYNSLKAAILVRYGINEESYRLKFRQTSTGKEETHRVQYSSTRPGGQVASRVWRGRNQDQG